MSEPNKAAAFPDEWQEDGVIVLVAQRDPDQKPRLYVCPKCGKGHSPAIYVAKPPERHAAAKDAAKNCYNCRTHNTCQDCGVETPKNFIRCDKCTLARVLNKATEVSRSEIEQCFGWNGEFYNSPDEAEDDGCDLVFDATFRHFRCDPDSVFTNILDDHFEDASPDDLVGARELEQAIVAFNEAQKNGSYDEDRSRYARLTPQQSRDLSPVRGSQETNDETGKRR